MTELQWLIKMLTQHKLPKGVKDLFIERLGEVEKNFIPPSSNGRTPGFGPGNIGSIPVGGTNQAPSTQAALMRQMHESPIEPPAAVAQTPGAAQALQARHQAIAQQVSGKPEPGRTSPRKF